MFHILWSLSNFSQVLFFRGTRLYWNLTPTTKNFGFPTAYVNKKTTWKEPVAGSQKVSRPKRKKGSEKIRGFQGRVPTPSYFFFPQLSRCLRLSPHPAFLTIHYSFTAPLPFQHEPCNTRLIFLGTDYLSVSLKLSLDMNMVSSMTFILPKPHLELVFGWLTIL